MKAKPVVLYVRLPEWLHTILATKAKENGQSLNQEVIFRLMQSLAKD